MSISMLTFREVVFGNFFWPQSIFGILLDEARVLAAALFGLVAFGKIFVWNLILGSITKALNVATENRAESKMMNDCKMTRMEGAWELMKQLDAKGTGVLDAEVLLDRHQFDVLSLCEVLDITESMLQWSVRSIPTEDGKVRVDDVLCRALQQKVIKAITTTECVDYLLVDYVEMVDQTTCGHQRLKKHFGGAAIPLRRGRSPLSATPQPWHGS